MIEHPDGRTKMIRYECGQCDMTATAIENAAARIAWREHMIGHHRLFDWREWRWTQLSLPFDDED